MAAEGPVESVEVNAFSTIHRSAVNLVSLASIQVANAIIPLVVYPLVLGVVKADRFARLVVTESVALLIVAVVIFSFDVEGVSLIAGMDVRREIDAISTIFSEVVAARAVIVMCCLVLLGLAYPMLDRMTFLLLAGWMLLPISYVLQSTWFFQGIERNEFVALTVVSTRLLALALVRLLVRQPDDVLLVPLIIGGTYSLAGAIILARALLSHRVRLQRVSFGRIGTVIARGRHIFVGNLSVTLYRGSNVLLLNAIGTSQAVVVYSIAEKSIKVLQAAATPLNQVFYPKVVRALGALRAPDRAGFRIIARYTTPQLGLLAAGTVLLGILVMFFRGFLPAAFRSAQALQIMLLVTVMLPAVFLGVANFMFGTAGLNFLGRRPYLASALLATGVANLVICSTLARLFGAWGASVSYVLAELTLFILVVRMYGIARRPLAVS